jgi:hypothetical protein
MLATIPKHKGTDKMQADIKHRIAKLRSQEASAKRTKHFDPYHIVPSGAGQVVLIGLPNVGKSAIVEKLTNAPVEVADYPFTTHAPVPGMVEYEDIQIQLIDMPPYTEHGFPPGMAGAIRSADLILPVIDASAGDVLEQLNLALRLLEERKIVPAGATKRPAEAGSPGGQDEQEGSVLWEKPMLIVATKIDLVGDSDPVVETLRNLYPQLAFLEISAATGENLNMLLDRMFKLLNVVRVYSKPPGHKPDLGAPFVLKAGSTVVDFARAIHRNLPDQLKYARIWGEGNYPGQQVPRDYVLQDKDILEIHT